LGTDFLYFSYYSPNILFNCNYYRGIPTKNPIVFIVAKINESILTNLVQKKKQIKPVYIGCWQYLYRPFHYNPYLFCGYNSVSISYEKNTSFIAYGKNIADPICNKEIFKNNKPIPASI
jgi:hypothetical protein